MHNTLYIGIAGLLFDAFAIGSALGIDPDGLGTILNGGAAATLVFPSLIGLGHEQFAIRAWPTLHKDLELAQSILDRAGATTTPLATSAASAIDRMVELRASYVAGRAADAAERPGR